MISVDPSDGAAFGGPSMAAEVWRNADASSGWLEASAANPSGANGAADTDGPARTGDPAVTADPARAVDPAAAGDPAAADSTDPYAEPAGQAGEQRGAGEPGDELSISKELSGSDDAPPPVARPDLSDPQTLRSAIEAVLFVVEAPVTIASLATALQRPAVDIEAAVAELRNEFDARRSGIELRDVAGGVRLYTRPEFASWVEAFLLEGQRARLTHAALETLAVIAYRQPVTRARISAIRGVNVDGVVRTLTARGLITEAGADPDTGGGLFRTTELFLEKMGLRSLDELPSLAPLLPELDGYEVDELSG